VDRDEVVPALLELDQYEFKFRDVHDDDAIAGRATGPRGARIDFGLVVGGSDSAPPVVPHLTPGDPEGCAGVRFYVASPAPEMPRAAREASWELLRAIDRAVLGLAPDAVCHP
jgi:hypothetical protein